MFNSSPDAILTKATGLTSVVISVIGDDDSDESCHFVLENKRQAQVMMQLHGKCVPKNLGKLIFCFMYICKLLKQWVNGQDIIDHHLLIRGIFIDKQLGCYHCIMSRKQFFHIHHLKSW